MMGEVVARTICGIPTAYQPGNWFNSAKFFDIEYQTYGWVFPDDKRRPREAHFHWRHKNDRQCVTVAYDKEDGAFLGINTFGIRMRHPVLDSWLTGGKSVDFVMEHLHEAGFDPEFTSANFQDIRQAYRSELKSTTT